MRVSRLKSFPVVTKSFPVDLLIRFPAGRQRIGKIIALASFVLKKRRAPISGFFLSLFMLFVQEKGKS